MNTDIKHPWDQLDDEPNQWFERFELFKELGPERTLIAVFRKAKDSKGLKRTANGLPGAWRTAIDRYQWWSRAHAWDLHQRQLRRQRLEEERNLIIDEIVAIAHKELLQKVKQMAEFPLARRTVDTEDGTVIVMPARWSFRDMAILTKAAMDLVNEATGHSEVDELRAIEMGIEAGFFPQEALEVASAQLREFKERVRQAISVGNFENSRDVD